MTTTALFRDCLEQVHFGRLRTRLANPFTRNLGWMGGAQIGIRVSRLATTVFLSRLLLPDDYGMAAIVLTIYELVALFTRNGISAKVVQAGPDEVERVAQTAYWLTWIVCILLLIVQGLIAQPIAWLYGKPELALPIALMGLIYLATPLCNIQCAFMQREGQLGRIALAGGLQVTADNILTAILALCGFGMWAIVLPKLLVAPIWVVVTRYGHAWRPTRPNGAGDLLTGWRDIARFSRSVLGVELMTTIQANIDNLLVGYFLGVEALGIYYFAFNAGLGIALGLTNGLSVAVYPHLCEVRADRTRLAARYRQSLRSLGSIVVPLVLLQVILAPIYVPIVFGAQWTQAVPVLMIVCLSALPRPFAATCSQLLKAVGRPDIELRWQVALTAVLIVALTVATQIGILGVAIAVLAVQATMLIAYCRYAPRSFIAPEHADTIPDSDSARDATRDARFTVTTDLAGLLALRSEWDALWHRVPNAFAAQGFAWCLAGWQTTGQPLGRRLHIVTLRENGRVVLIWPLTIQSGWTRTTVTTLGSESSEYDSLLVEAGPDAAEHVRQAWDHVRRHTGADVIALPFVRDGSPMQTLLAADPVQRIAHGMPAPFTSWENAPTWDAYWQTLAPSLRKGFGRRRRRLAELGTISLDRIEDPTVFAELIDWTLARKRDWMTAKNVANEYLGTPEYRDFFQTLARARSDTGTLAMFALRLDGVTIATKLGVLDGTRYEGFVTVYDPAYAAYSPGQIILADCLKWCHERGLEYDFRIGEEAYKQGWANGQVVATSYRIANTRRGAMLLGYATMCAELRCVKDQLREQIPPHLRRSLKNSIKTSWADIVRRPAQPAGM